MKKNSWSVDFIPLFITYIGVKVVHKLVGFQYDIIKEGVIHIKFLVDIMTWGIMYAIVYILLKKLFPKKETSVE